MGSSVYFNSLGKFLFLFDIYGLGLLRIKIQSGEMSQLLRAVTALAGDLDLIPSTQSASLPQPVIPALGDLVPFSGLLWAPAFTCAHIPTPKYT